MKHFLKEGRSVATLLEPLPTSQMVVCQYFLHQCRNLAAMGQLLLQNSYILFVSPVSNITNNASLTTNEDFF